MRATTCTLASIALAFVLGIVLIAAAPYYEQVDGHHGRSVHLMASVALLIGSFAMYALARAPSPGALFFVTCLVTSALIYPAVLLRARFISGAEAFVASAGVLLLYLAISAIVALRRT